MQVSVSSEGKCLVQVSDSSAGTCFQCLSYGVVYVVQCQSFKKLASKYNYFWKTSSKLNRETFD